MLSMNNKKGGYMNLEVLDMVKKMDFHNWKIQLVLQCAPLISGLKMANLFLMENQNFSQLKLLLKNTGISYSVLLKGEEKMFVLLYMELELNKYLREERVKKLLRERGYHSNFLYDILPIFRKKYMNYMIYRTGFPHEMGILLGYPIEDVEGFIVHQGRNYLGIGPWKVYENMSEKEQMFREFDQAKETMIGLLFCGMSMESIIEMYRHRQKVMNIV